MSVGTRKRVVDLTVGTVLAIVVLPVIAALALGAAVSLRTWPFFVQDRVGRRGRSFRMVKIRTLPVSAPARATKYEVRDIPLPRFCRFLRTSHLDELPQLLLVPIGRMSLVGPRPEMPSLAATYDHRFLTARTSMRPGCTGLWQVSVDAVRLIDEIPDYDLYYVRQADLRLDLWVYWHTVRSFLPWAEPITLEDVFAYGRRRALPGADWAQPRPERVRARLDGVQDVQPSPEAVRDG